MFRPYSQAIFGACIYKRVIQKLKIRTFSQSLNWTALDQPTDSSDFAPRDFHLFLHLKKYLAG